VSTRPDRDPSFGLLSTGTISTAPAYGFRFFKMAICFAKHRL
jgi:hypothetical protein